MHIVYCVTTCSDKVYAELFSKVPIKPAFQSQKYHRLLIEGLAANAQVDVVANPPVNKSLLDCPIVHLEDEEEGGARYHYIPAIRSPIRKLITVAAASFWKTFSLANKDSVVVVDCLNRMAALFGLLASRLRRCRCVGIVTDLPDMLGGSRFSVALANFVIAHCTDYVLMTDAMNDYLNPTGKPYVVLEGHSDITMREHEPSMALKESPRVCMYAGGVSKQYGLGNLVEGFRMANLANAVLHIYGPGDYVEELKQVAEKDSRVVYGGMLMNADIVRKEQQATLLVNPRPTNEEYVKYSFPSKTMEYMASGTPVLTTVLPGMPKEYYPFVYLLEEESPEGISKMLETVLGNTDEALFEKGQKAREFVLDQRNNVVQAKKILEMLN